MFRQQNEIEAREELSQLIIDAVGSMQKHLPKKITDVSEIFKCETDGKEVTYYHRVFSSDAKAIAATKSVTKKETLAKVKLGKGVSEWFVSGVVFTYIYHDENKKEVYRFSLRKKDWLPKRLND